MIHLPGFVAAWSIFGMVGWSIWAMVRDGFQSAKRMHQIPCANCQYFTGSYYLKCAVRPSVALSEEAIGCSDYF